MALLFLLLFVVWGVFAWMRPQWSVIVLSAMFPLYLVRFHFLGVPFTLVEWCIYASTLAFISHELYQRWFPTFWQKMVSFVQVRRECSWKEMAVQCVKSMYFPLFLFVVAGLVSVMIVPETVQLLGSETLLSARKIALGVFKGFLLSGALYFVLFTQFLHEKLWVRRALYAFGLSAVAVSLWAIWQVVSQTFLTPDLRASGPFVSANYLSLFIAPAFLFFIGSLWFHWTSEDEEDVCRWQIVAEILAAVLILIALYFSKSFGAFIGIVFAMVAFFLFQWHTLPRKFFLWSGVLLLVLAGIFATQFHSEKFQQLLSPDRSSWQVRKEVWTVSFGLLQEHPILGVGLGQFENQYMNQAPHILGQAPLEWVMLHPHNVYLMFWLSMGFAGLALFLWFVADGCMVVRRSWGMTDRHLVFIAGALLVYILVHGFLDVPFWKNDLALQFWMVMGALKMKA